MQHRLTWRKGLFSETTNIFSGFSPVGRLKAKFFSQSVDAELKGVRLSFQTKGVFRQETLIVDAVENRVIGIVKYHSWLSRASVEIRGELFEFKNDNAWSTRWSLSGRSGATVKYSKPSFTGYIDANTENPLLVLSGLFIIQHFQRTTAIVFVAVFIPMIVRLILH